MIPKITNGVKLRNRNKFNAIWWERLINGEIH